MAEIEFQGRLIYDPDFSHSDWKRAMLTPNQLAEERELIEAQRVKREAEMAACPYVACTCGHHDLYD